MSEEASAPEGAVEITGTQASIPSTQLPTEAPAVEFESLIPEAYADKGWVKDVKDVEAMFKMTDDLKSEMGKRPAGIPQENEDWGDFNKLLGVPETADGYELPESQDPEFQSALKELLHKADITPRQLKTLAPGFDELMAGLSGKEAQDPEAVEAEFEKITGEVFGERKDEALNNAKDLLSAHVPDQFKDHINNLSNQELVIMASVLDSVQQKYINEDDIPRGTGSVAQGMSGEEKRAKGVQLMQSAAWNDRSHPDHAKVSAQVKEIYGT